MVGDVLNRKLLRDVKGAWPQFAAAVAVVFCATTLFVSMFVVHHSMVCSRDEYYERRNFAEFFVDLEKAPESALYDVESIPGVWRAQGRIVEDVTLDVEGNESAVVGRFISLPDVRDDIINDVRIVTGGYFPGAAATEVMVNHRFAEANGLEVGDSFQATINERKEDLRIVGTVYSPEYVYAIRTVQQLAPNYADFAVVFARKSFVEDAFDMTNAFNNVVGLLRPGADVDRVLDAVKDRLDNYGVYVKYGRKDHPSDRYLAEELKGLKKSTRVVPMIFMVVAAIVIHIIVHRIVEQQRTQVGLLCALGYPKLRIVTHYMSYALLIGGVGTLLGTVVGFWLAGGWVQMYNEFYRIPDVRVVPTPSAVLIAAALSCGMCVAGAARSAWQVLQTQPAVAIRPAAPESARAVRAGRWQFLLMRLGLVWRIALRNTFRARSRTAFCIFGVAVSMMMLVIGATTMDFFEWIIDYQFEKVDRSDIRVDFALEQPDAAVLEIAAVEGVQHAEGVFSFGAEIRNGWRKKLVVVQGLSADSRMFRLFDTDGNRVSLPRDGLLLPERVAVKLGVTKGSTLMIDPYLRDKDERPAVVRGVIDTYLGIDVYADRRYLAELMEDGPVVNGVLVDAGSGTLDSIMDRLDDLPGVAAVTSTRSILRSFVESVTEMINVAVVIQTLASAIIAFAVIYNATAVSIAEQERDLACMRSLGYDQDDVAHIATNAIMPLGLIGIAIGTPMAYLASIGIAKSFETDLYKLPVVVNPVTYARSAVLVLIFLLVARWLSARRVFRIDMVKRLKTME